MAAGSCWRLRLTNHDRQRLEVHRQTETSTREFGATLKENEKIFLSGQRSVFDMSYVGKLFGAFPASSVQQMNLLERE